jgi:hypothetical protein
MSDQCEKRDSDSSPQEGGVTEQISLGGVHVMGGSVSVKVTVGAATARAGGGSPRAVVQTRLLRHWVDIALEQEELARKARLELKRLQEEGKGLPLDAELRPSIQTVAAAAHALDAIYGEIAETVLPLEVREKWKDRASRPGRARQINEALKCGLRVKADRWLAELDWLFEQARDPAVHPKLRSEPTAQHPLGFGTAPEYVLYSTESAARALTLLCDVLEACSSSAKPALDEWAKEVGPIAQRFEKRPSSEGTAIRVSPEPADEAGLSFAPTPGPGDSDGGDVYAP